MLPGCGQPHFKGDNVCDDGNNNEGCSYDGGDCCADEVEGGIPSCMFCTTCLCHLDQKHACGEDIGTTATTVTTATTSTTALTATTTKELISSMLGNQKIIYDRQYIHISHHI